MLLTLLVLWVVVIPVLTMAGAYTRSGILERRMRRSVSTPEFSRPNRFVWPLRASVAPHFDHEPTPAARATTPSSSVESPRATYSPRRLRT